MREHKLKKSQNHSHTPPNLERDGYLLVDNFLSVNACRQLLRKIADHTRESPAPLINRKMEDRSLLYRVIDGVRIRQSLPEIQNILPEVLKQIRQHCRTEQVLINDEVAAINVNITEPGGSYRWHFDRNAVTAILYINEVGGGETEIIPNSRLHLGRFKHTVLQGWLDRLTLGYLKSKARKLRRIEARPGRLLLMQGDRCYHSVCEVTGDEERINVVMTFDKHQQTFPTTQSLNPYLYSAASIDPQTDPNYIKGVKTTCNM